MAKVLIVEPFYEKSQRQLLEMILEDVSVEEYTLLITTGEKSSLAALCSCISQRIPDLSAYGTIFCSSVVDLSELIELRPEIDKLKKIVYVHENQFFHESKIFYEDYTQKNPLVRPYENISESDTEQAYKHIVACLSADTVVFNSFYSKRYFLQYMNIMLEVMDMEKFWLNKIASKMEIKTRIIFFPIDFSEMDMVRSKYRPLKKKKKILHIVWPDRWNAQDNPIEFFEALDSLLSRNIDFRVTVFNKPLPHEQEKIQPIIERLKDKILHFGHITDREEMYKLLIDADVVVSTAIRKFSAVSVLEAIRCGCLPLVPNSFVYLDYILPECRYYPGCLGETLELWCRQPYHFACLKERLDTDTENFSAKIVLPKYRSLLFTPRNVEA